jgi:diguanylate cyclase (GGDEF)-like protein/PAS domain S-box-containing protein
VLVAVAYAAAVLVGRATRLPGTSLALVWPAAAVGVVWVALARGRRRPAAVLGLALVSGTLNALTGAGAVLGAVYGVANAVQGVGSWLVLARLARTRRRAPLRLRDRSDLIALLVAATAGPAAAALIGPVGLHLTSGAELAPTMGAWVLRNAVGTFLGSAALFRLAEHARPHRTPAPPPLSVARTGEAVAAVLLTLALYTLVFGQPFHLPMSFLLLPVSVWVAVRWPTTAATVHVLGVGLLVVAYTVAGTGPFAIAEPEVTVLVAQAYVSVVGVVTLVLALQRDAHDALTRSLVRAREHLSRQAGLLRTVIETTDRGISVYDAHGRPVLQNTAARTTLARLPLGVGGDEPDEPRATTPEGPPDLADQPLARALRGEQVEQTDVVVDDPQDTRVIAVTAHPMPPAPSEAWDGGALLITQDVTAERAAAHDVLRDRDLLASVLDAATEQAIIGCDAQGRVAVFNPGATRMLGWPAEEILGRPITLLHDPLELEVAGRELGCAPRDVVPRLARDGISQARRWTYLRRDGSRLQVSVTVTPTHEDAGLICVATDVTAQVAAQADLADSEIRFRLAFDTAPVSMFIVAIGERHAAPVLDANATATAFTGKAADAMLGADLHSLVRLEDRPTSRMYLAAVVRGETPRRPELRYPHVDGTTRWGTLSASLVRPTAESSRLDPYVLCLVEDVTARKSAEAALIHQTLHDGLTGLPNRALLRDRLERAVAGTARERTRVGVLFCDLDGFKEVNDTAGHAAGDRVLQQVAARFSSVVRPVDTLARLGGDEFAVVCPGIEGIDDLREIGDRLLGQLADPVGDAAAPHLLGVSIGMVLAAAGDDVDVLLAHADAAMYEAKRAGRNRAHAYAHDTEHRVTRTERLLPELRTALARGELVVVAQPIRDLATGRTVAVETLMRWQHPERGLLSPGDFLDALEASPLIVAAGNQVLDESCRLAAGWHRLLGADAPAVHVNISGRQLEHRHFVRDVLAAVEAHGLPAHRLVLELTETHMPRLTSALRSDLQTLRERGVRIAIDDLGTGYSSLARLTELPVDILKIDRTFVAGLGSDPSCDAVVRAVLGIGRALGMPVIAEGVELAHQVRTLDDLGCTLAQGYHLGRPVPRAEIAGAFGAVGAGKGLAS